MPRTRATIRRHPERALALPADADAILHQAMVAHVGIAIAAQPYVIPMTFLHEEGKVYLHGAPGSRTIQHLAKGGAACVEVTLVDGLIASKSAETHSVNYRSVVLFGHGARVTDESRRRVVLERLISRYFPGRTAGEDYAPITEAEMKATWLVEVPIEDVSAKGRDGGPRGPFDADDSAPGNAGVHPVPTGGV